MLPVVEGRFPMSQRIRPQVLGVARRDGALFVSELTDPGSGETFYRPPGGGVEFGERSAKAVVREFREELDATVEPVGYLGTVENRFEWNGDPAHEIAVVHEVEFEDDRFYEEAPFRGVDAGGAVTYDATWEPLGDLLAGERPLYPEGLAELLDGDAVHLVV
jgi:ADP-ribose pyrophosphatase YjhB (NUDIX family)